MVEVRVENVAKNFRGTAALKDINLTIRDQEFFILLGPSGSGKSTLLNIIAGLEQATSGHVYFDKELTDGVPPENRDVAMVFQSYALFPHMTVFENIAFGFKIRKTPREQIRRNVEEVTQLLHISHLLDRKPFQLSGGERQRVALARAIARRPRLFLLDEPLSNLDAKLRVLMRAELIRLQKLIKTTTIYVTHDQIEAVTLGDRVAVINKGEVVQLGPPLEIYNRPRDLFVAGFVGSPPMNFIDFALREEDGRFALTFSGASIPISTEKGQLIKSNANGDRLLLGIRPEDVNVSTQPIDHGVRVEVFAVEPLGPNMIVDLSMGDSVVRALSPPTYPGKIGDTAWMSFHADRIHVFDKKTEKAIL